MLFTYLGILLHVIIIRRHNLVTSLSTLICSLGSMVSPYIVPAIYILLNKRAR